MYRIGVDLGGTNIVSAVIDEGYNIIGKARVATNADRPAKAIFEDIAKTAFDAVKAADLTMDDVESIGIGTPGSVNKESGVIEYANNLNFDKVPAREMLNALTGKDKIYIDNDANCAALGEAVAGVGKGVRDLIAITLGTGVGAGIVVGGKLLTGCNYAGAELGHTVIVYDGEPCTCGRKGCWEAYSSATALIAQSKRAMLADPYTKMWDIAGTIDNVGGRTSFDAMRQGDATATAVVKKYMSYLACGVTNLVNAFQPEILCIGGGIGNEGEFLLKPLRRLVAAQRYSIHAEKQTQILPAKLGNDAGIIGAAMLDE